MIIKSSEFLTSAVKPSQYPEPGPPEIAFAGRSNVGKSSLINVLLNRKRLVKASSTPGRTQLINFFNINNAFSFVDLPGYGYAKVPVSVSKTWGPMIETYLQSRTSLKGVVMILDIRRDPREGEFNLLDWLNHNQLDRIIVVTKADKLSKTKQKQRLASIANVLSMRASDLILFSAKSRLGKERVWERVDALLGFENPCETTETGAQIQSETQTETQTTAKTNIKTKIKAKTKAKAKTKGKTKAKTKTKAKKKTKAKTKTKKTGKPT